MVAHIQGIATGEGSGNIADADGPSTGTAPPAVQEPATLLLLGSGLIGVAGYGRRRFKKS